MFYLGKNDMNVIFFFNSPISLFIMFNLDNFELDIDDDFSSNIFSKEITPRKKSTISREEVCQQFTFSNQSTSNYDLKKLDGEQSRAQTGLEVDSNNFFNFSSVKNSSENNLKRSFLQDEKPQKKRLSKEGLLQRKFPGPAGLLPDKPCKEISDLSLIMENHRDEEENKDSKEDTIIYSQHSGSVFLASNYQKLIADFNLNEPNNPLNKYTIEWVKKTALSKGLQGRKIPFLGLVVHSVHQGMPDPILVLRDPTGEIHGGLHREVWTDMGGKLKAGIALALRQVGVLITGVIRRQIYLNITMNNILCLYSPSENDNQVEVTSVNSVSKLELFKSFEEWLANTARHLNPSNSKSSLDSSLFTTANDINDFSKNKEEIIGVRNKFENCAEGSKQKKAKDYERNTEEVLANLGIVITDSDFNEEMTIPQSDSRTKKENLQGDNKILVHKNTSSQILSEEESLIFEDVLSGINLDEFDM